MEIANKIIEIALKYVFEIYFQLGHFFNTLKIKKTKQRQSLILQLIAQKIELKKKKK